MPQRVTKSVLLALCGLVPSPTFAQELANRDAVASSVLTAPDASTADIPSLTELVAPATTPASVQPVASSHSTSSPWTLELDYLLWGLNDVYLPVLLASNPVDAPLADIGLIGAPSTQLLFGDKEVGDWPQSGLRARLRRRLFNGMSLELSGWHLFERGEERSIASDAGNPILSRPFIDATRGLADAQVISMPGVADGSLQASYERRVSGVDALSFVCLDDDGCNWWEGFFGYRFLRYQDKLRIAERIELEPGGVIAPGTGFYVVDTFRALNDYHVFPLGLSYTRRNDCWRFNLRGSVGLGFVRQKIEIAGRTEITVAGETTETYDAGLLALSSNSGVHERHRLAWVPELNLAVERKLTRQLAVHVGYTILYLNEIARAPDHVDTSIDPNLIPPTLVSGSDRPAFELLSNGEWLHGLNCGIRYDF